MNLFRLCYIFASIFFCCLRGAAFAQCSEAEILNLRKTAIVFGESSYKYFGPLINTTNDARDISDSLKKVGFSVLTYIDTDFKTMNDAVENWSAKLSNYDVALFYFSGHGAEVNGYNFLFPVDALPKGVSDLNTMTYPANKLIEILDNSQLKYSVLILDACRDNPFTRGWNRGAGNDGLAPMSGRGTFIAFAASPGKKASDGNNRNGTYTEGILKNITVPNKNINDIFTSVNGYVRRVSNGEQIPFFNSSFGTDYCFSVIRKRNLLKNYRYANSASTSSTVAFSPNQDIIFSVTENGEINLRDTKSLNIIRTLVGIPYRVNTILPIGNTLIASDTIGKRVLFIDWQTDKITKEFVLRFVPTAMILSADKKRLYVTGNQANSGYIITIETSGKRAGEPIPLPKLANTIAMDDKQVYLLASDKTSAVLRFNINSNKFESTPLQQTHANVIALTPDKRKLLIADSTKSGLQLLDIASNTEQTISDVSVKSIAVSEDSRYAFAITNDRISIIRLSDGKVVKKMQFFTSPAGLVMGGDSEAFVWLPREARLFTFNLKEQLKDEVLAIDPEEKLKRFQQEISSDPSLPDELRKREFCRRLKSFSDGLHYHFAHDITWKLVKALSDIRFSVLSSNFPAVNCDKTMSTFSQGIQSVKDSKKRVNPIFTFEFGPRQLTLTLQDTIIDKRPTTLTLPLKIPNNITEENIHMPSVPLSKEDQLVMEKFVRDYFIERFDYLK
jgi:hypothetical protein